MPRRRNQETIRRIVDTAWNLFMERGYNEASYGEIAAVSGINRATVQHYFPKKELMASVILQRLRESAVEIARETFPKVEDNLSRLYLLGQVYLASLLCSDASCRFLCDVLEDRTLTDETIAADFYWTQEFMGDDDIDESVQNEDREDMIVAMGGLYELMFYCVKEGVPFDIARRLKPAFLILSRMLGVKKRTCEKVFECCAIEQKELETLGRKCFDRAAKQDLDL